MLKQLLDHAVSIAPAKTWPTYDGKNLDRAEFLTSSEVASCLRQSYFSKHSKGGGFSNGFAERGNAIEAWLVEKLYLLEQLGYQFQYCGKEQRSFYDPELGLSGTPDGIMVTPEGKWYLLEFKSIDPRTNKNNLPKLKHRYQVQQNMYLVQKCLDVKLEGAVLFYVDASDLFDVREYFLQYDQTLVDECIQRANELWEAKKPDDLDPEGVYNGDCDRCPFTGLCSAVIGMDKELAAAGAAAAPFSASLPPNEGETLLSEDEEEILSTFLYARKELKEFADQVEGLKDDVNKMIVKRNGITVFDGYVLTATMSPGRETIDKKMLEAAGLDPDDFKKVGKPYVTLNVKEQR